MRAHETETLLENKTHTSRPGLDPDALTFEKPLPENSRFKILKEKLTQKLKFTHHCVSLAQNTFGVDWSIGVANTMGSLSQT